MEASERSGADSWPPQTSPVWETGERHFQGTLASLSLSEPPANVQRRGCNAEGRRLYSGGRPRSSGEGK